jgi:hypothetical protein
MAAANLQLVPPQLSPVATTFEAEIKRYAAETGLEIREVMRKLSEFSGISENHLYNYRNGKTDIPLMLIPVFCRQFNSNALAMAIVDMCDAMVEIEERNGLDLTMLCSHSVRDMLRVGEVFQDITSDGHIDGHEEIRFAGEVAKLGIHKNRMFETVKFMRRRRQNDNAPAAA